MELGQTLRDISEDIKKVFIQKDEKKKKLAVPDGQNEVN